MNKTNDEFKVKYVKKKQNSQFEDTSCVTMKKTEK